MSFLSDQNLTFHRFSDGTISTEGRLENGTARSALEQHQEESPPVWTTHATMMDYSINNPTLLANETVSSTRKILVADEDEAAEDDKSISKRYSTYSSTTICNNSTASGVPQQNGSTMKLIQVQRDDDSKQVSR